MDVQKCDSNAPKVVARRNACAQPPGTGWRSSDTQSAEHGRLAICIETFIADVRAGRIHGDVMNDAGHPQPDPLFVSL